ncbi:MAG: pyridoxal phosphate-dependent class II aminotransferase [Eubacteriales bacterium]|nr:pyridoxal phosphate-dependent class II aminotransferase [Eubacteriales bacterium]
MQKNQHGGDIYTNKYRIDFSANINPLGMPESVRTAACQGVALSANYPDVQYRELRRAIAGKEKVSEEDIICGNGAAELIFLLASAVKPVRTLLTAPGFAEYEQALTAAGCQAEFYELREETGFALQEDYLKRLKEGWDMVFLCNPNNPTGVTIPPGFLREILNICKEENIKVVLDLCFLDFLEEREEADFVRDTSDYPNLFVLKAFTKTYAMAGLRLGYGICTDKFLLEKMESITQPWNISIPAQMAGVAALKEKEYVERARKLVTGQRIWLSGQLKELGLTVYDSRANFLFWKGPAGLTEKCREQGILLRDCGNYRGLKDVQEQKGYYRVAVRTPEENKELVNVLKGVLKWQK